MENRTRYEIRWKQEAQRLFGVIRKIGKLTGSKSGTHFHAYQPAKTLKTNESKVEQGKAEVIGFIHTRPLTI